MGEGHCSAVSNTAKMTYVSALRVHTGIMVNMLHLLLLDCTTGNTTLQMKEHATLKSDDLICFPSI